MAACGKSPSVRTAQGIIWNTSYHITYTAGCNLDDTVLQALNAVGRSLSVFDTASLVSRVNAAGGRIGVDSLFCRVLRESWRVNRASHGRFDPTVSPLVTAWGFGKGHTPTADTARIDSMLRFVGLDKCCLDGSVLVKLHPGLQFNFSAIAKGLGCDMAADALSRNGVKDCLVEIGGEITALGRSPRGDRWKVSVDRPVAGALPGEQSQAILELPSPCGLATSGNYRNFHADGSGQRFGHTIDPVTGRPCLSTVISATVIAPTAMEADALATACMAMETVQALHMIDSLGHAAMLVLADSSMVTTPSFRALMCP